MLAHSLYLHNVLVLRAQTHLHLFFCLLPYLDDPLRCRAKHPDYAYIAVPRWIGRQRVLECGWGDGGGYVCKTCEYHFEWQKPVVGCKNVVSDKLLIHAKELSAPMMVYTASPFVGYDMVRRPF